MTLQSFRMNVKLNKVLCKSVLRLILLVSLSSGEESFFYLGIWVRTITVKK